MSPTMLAIAAKMTKPGYRASNGRCDFARKESFSGSPRTPSWNFGEWNWRSGWDQAAPMKKLSSTILPFRTV